MTSDTEAIVTSNKAHGLVFKNLRSKNCGRYCYAIGNYDRLIYTINET